MIKFMSKIIGSQVLLFQEKAIVGEVQKILIDPEDGAFVGLVVLPVHQKKITYIPSSEIKGFGQGLVLIEGIDSLSEEDDVVRLKKVINNQPNWIGARVVTESGKRVGKIDDVTIDLKYSVLNKLYINPIFGLGFLGTQRIVDRKQIVKIEKNVIVVKDTIIKAPATLRVPAEAPVAE